MSRSWKAPNNSLPGCRGYHIPKYGFSKPARKFKYARQPQPKTVTATALLEATVGSMKTSGLPCSSSASGLSGRGSRPRWRQRGKAQASFLWPSRSSSPVCNRGVDNALLVRIAYTLHMSEPTGAWFCSVCNESVEVNLDHEQTVCEECGSPHVKWRLDNAPVLRPMLAIHKPSRLSLERAASLFSSLRQSVSALKTSTRSSSSWVSCSITCDFQFASVNCSTTQTHAKGQAMALPHGDKNAPHQTSGREIHAGK